MSTLIRLSVLALGFAIVGTSGCRSARADYHVQVRNETSATIRAMVMHDSDTNLGLVTDAQVGPHDRRDLSMPLRKAKERLVLLVDAPNNPAAPARMPLSPGMTFVKVTRRGDVGAIDLELVRNN